MACPKILKYGGFFLLGIYTANFLYESPQIASVTCQKGLKWTINDVDDLLRLIPELECIFRGGITPSKVPEGALAGDIIRLGTQGLGLLRPVVTSIWAGKYLSPAVQCKGPNKVHIGWNLALGRVVTAPFQAFIGHAKDKVNISHPSHLDNSKASLIIQNDLSDLDCPDLKPTYIKRSPFNKGIYPAHRFVDELRLVGRQKDGGAILLGRTLLRDPYVEHTTSTPVIFFTVISYDSKLNPGFNVGQSLPPSTQETSHIPVERRDFYRILCSFDDLLQQPSRTLTRIFEQIQITSFNMWNVVPEILWDLVSPGEDSATIQKAFENLPVGLELKVSSQAKQSIKTPKATESNKQPNTPQSTPKPAKPSPTVKSEPTKAPK